MPVIPIVKSREALSIPCRETTIEEARPVIQDLMDTAHYHKKTCAGLASNQIGSNVRVFVVKIRGKFIAFINPSFIPIGARIRSTESCLSFPGKTVKVSRFKSVLTSPPKGKCKGLSLNGIAAIAFQHELDHLNGIAI